MDRQHTIAILQAALFDFEHERYDAVIERLEHVPGHEGSFGEALILASRGLLSERSGDTSAAIGLMERAFEHAVTVPSLLDAFLAFFRRTGRMAMANHAFLLGQLVWPRSDAPEVGWVREVPPTERVFHVPWAMRSSPWVANGDLLGLAPFKSALVDQLGPDGAAIVLSRMRRTFVPRRPRRRQLVPLVEHAREHGHAYEELIEGGPAAWDPSWADVGELEPMERYVLPLFACILDDVIVQARSAVLLAGDRALLDVHDDILRREPVDFGVDPMVVSGTPDELVLLEPMTEGIETMAEAVWLCGVFSPEFGHWVLEFLPKIWALMRREGFADVPILVDEGMPDQHLEALRSFIGEEHPIRVLDRDECVLVRRLWTASALVYLSLAPPYPPRSIEQKGPLPRSFRLDEPGFRRLLERGISALGPGDTSGAPDRIYLTRKASQRRRLLNASEIDSILAEHGYVAYDFGEVTFSEQLRLMRGASHVVAAAGSAMLMTMFAPPGLQLVVMTPEWIEVGFTCRISRALDHDFTALIGSVPDVHPEYSWQSDYEIDPAVLIDALTGTPGPVMRDADRERQRRGASPSRRGLSHLRSRPVRASGRDHRA